MFDCTVSVSLTYIFMNVSHKNKPIYFMKKKGNTILIKPFNFQSSFCSLFMYGSAAWVFLDRYSH